MKKIIALLLATGTLSLANAQEAQTAPAPQNPQSQPQVSKPSPEMIATRNSMHLQKMLGLTEDQKQKTYQAILTRTTTLQSIHAKYGPNGDKKAMHAEAKPVKEQYVQTMNGILTPEQKVKWDENRLKMKERHMKNASPKNDPAPATGGNGAPQKLMNDDDGIDD